MNKAIGGIVLQKMSKLLEPENPETTMIHAWVIVGIIVISLVSYGIYIALSGS